MSEAPERIWAWLDQTELARADGIPEGEWTGDEAPAFPHTEYIKASTLSALQDQNRALREALENVMGHIDTPIARRRLGIRDPHPEWLIEARAATKQEGGE